MLQLYNSLSFDISKLVTKAYSTSFSRSVSFLDREIRDAIYSIYGFVRLADEIVDTFHDFDKHLLIREFEDDFYRSLQDGISLNPVLNSFRLTVKKYGIDDSLIQAFLKSMKLDLQKLEHSTKEETDEYIYGSAEVVGLMCLKVFVNGDEAMYHELENPARKLGSAFQKVNFLRDLKNDTQDLKRQYFHNLAGKDFTEQVKTEIINDIEEDFSSSVRGMKKLPGNARLGVLIAYYYYLSLLRKIRRTPADGLLQKRIRINDSVKLLLLLKALIANRLNII
ncbi:MAG TPA: phytoene/squalene synthase family protein [Bacteroidales bacterium]|nr:phytoene/squalene synthase family protein [Bacteroidales bacterium]HRW83849.1 phytoene/squalene synthase family protein [Bacteroidales bacterium]